MTIETVEVMLFKPSGKFYTEERWRIPYQVPDHSEFRGDFVRPVIGPYDMQHSPDFRRIDGGAVLIPTQEPWGYPFLFSEVREITRGALRELGIEVVG